MKARTIFLSLILCISLSGCTNFSSSFEEKMIAGAGIEEDTNYQQYQAFEREGKLNEQGYYREDIFAEEEIAAPSTNAGTIHVTFASNNYLDISYFKDSACTEKLVGAECYLNPGDKIYSQVIENECAPEEYMFSEFLIYKHENGKRRQISSSVQNQNGLVLELTEDYENAELAIEPIGKFEPMSIALHDYWKGEDDVIHELNGTWIIDEKPIIGERVTLNPTSSYIICYDYDESQYFYVGSTPAEFEHIPAEGLVIFEQRISNNNAPTEYIVELQKCITAVISSDVDRKIAYKVNMDISTNNQNDKGLIADLLQDSIDAETPLEISGLTYEDTICIITDKEWKEIDKCQQLVIIGNVEYVYDFVGHNPVKYYKYVLQVPPAENAFEFNPNEYSYEHGTISFMWRGQEVNHTVYIPVNGTLHYKAKTHEERYGLTAGTIKIVEDANKNREMLESITFVEQVKRTVELNQPDFGGKIIYKVDDKIINDKTYIGYPGTVITMDFDAWEGWECAYQSGMTYEIPHRSGVAIDVYNIFKEAERHKPSLEVILDKSLGTNMQFGITISGHETVYGHFEENLLEMNKMFTLKKWDRIGTEKGISISITNDTVLSGTAVKVLIEKTDVNGNIFSDYIFIDDLTVVRDPIPIYEKAELGVSAIRYESIKIYISLVEVIRFIEPNAVANATISVKNSIGKYLKSGDLIERDEVVVLTIQPKNGYYVGGKHVENDIYISTMKFSKYQSDIQSIIQNHPIGKYYKVILIDGDTYGECTYKLEGKSVSGTILAKEGQKLTMQYKITSNGYAFDDTDRKMLGIGKHDKQKSNSITVTAALDEITISRDHFGITIVKE